MYYSTGKSPYERRRGIPSNPHPNTAESLVKKGYLVRSLAELDGNKAEEEDVVELAQQAVTDVSFQNIEIKINDDAVVQRRKTAKQKPAKAKAKPKSKK